MKKPHGLINRLMFSKKKINNPSRSLDNSTNNSVSKLVNYNSKVSKYKQRESINDTDNSKIHNSAIENKKFLPPQNYSNNSKIKNQNHSFTASLSSDILFLHLSNKRSPSNHNNPLNPQPQIQNQERKIIPIPFMQPGNSKHTVNIYNKLKQKIISPTNIHGKQSPNASFNHLHQNLLSKLKKKKVINIRTGKLLNKSMGNYEEDWYEKDSHSNVLQSLSLVNRLKVIEEKLDDGLKDLYKTNEGKLAENGKSYILYKMAFEEILKEIPKDYYEIIKKIFNGYHEIIITFLSEHKKVVKSFEELKTKYSFINQGLSAYKSLTNIMEKYGDQKASKRIKPIDIKKASSNIKDNNNREHHQQLIEGNNVSLDEYTNMDHTSNQNSNTNQNNNDPMKNEDSQSVNNTNINKESQVNQTNKTDLEDLDGLYFSDRVDMGNRSPIDMSKNVPKLSLDFLG